ncbi:hypothetical protein DMB38_12795 [Streptomyces sp. WAC 06738]|uniref:hypothetical protein n=1 Tax=Streptomyces sp. WAC 06738 TaxID=2203210 RepID=UPI000F71447A|nr:hypothetical protein [Streptomyces sp. WAC 06738]AZM46574.1 hypothetical protein DMB38_12795 [Streptomyces sp. WAC 06738]
MPKNTLPRHAGRTRRAALSATFAPGWAHPYGHGPFSPALYADGGDEGGDGSGSSGGGDAGGDEDGSEGGDGGGDGGEDRGGKPKPTPRRAGGDDADATIKRLEKDLADARREAGKSRTEAKKQAAQEAESALVKKLGVALGLVKDEDEEPDPAKLLEQLKESQGTTTAAQEDAASARIELTVIRTAYGMGVDGDKLLDSRRFCDEVDNLDPSDPKAFKAALKKAITDAAEKNPALRYGGGKAGRSGGDLSGGSGEGGVKRRSGSLAGAIRDHYQT